MSDARVIFIPEIIQIADLKAKLSEQFDIRKTGQTTFFETYFDTFDWRIYNAGFNLKQIQKTFILTKISSNEPEQRTGFRTKPVFKDDFPDGPIKDIIAPLIGVRALMGRAKLKIHEIKLDCLNSDKKIVCRLNIREIEISKETVITSVSIFPLRGYTSDAKVIHDLLKPKQVQYETGDEFHRIMDALNLEPGGYSSKVQFKLDSKMKTTDGIRLILKKLLSIIRLNEFGVINDIDSEFLHDFRVAIRRTRSVLSQLDDVFIPGSLDSFKKEFTWLGKSSNVLRDLDVYLLNELRYKQLAPPEMKSEIEALFKKLRIEREKEYRKLIRLLKTKKYKSLLSGWEQFLNIENEGVKEEVSILNYIKPVIYTQFTQVIKKGQSIDKNSKDKKLHNLRIECKKLRYLLEFFASLFNSNQISYLVKQLKSLQDNLGEYNDYSVQLTFLHNQIERLKQDDPETIKVSAALGALIGSLYQKKLQVRLQFRERFRQFAGNENLLIAETMFKK